jgi:ERCC4-related helicase
MNKNDRARNELMNQMEEIETPPPPPTPQTQINNLLAQIEKLNRIISLYEDDATFSGYYALNRLYNDQIEYLKEVDIKELIAKDGKEYERVMKIVEGLPDVLSGIAKMKTELNPTGIEDADIKGKVARRSVISPEFMSNHVPSNSTGKNS